MKIIKNIKTLAALLIAGAAFTACSTSSDDITTEQPQNSTEPKVYTMVIKASKGGDAKTRALSLDGKTLNVYWSGSETIEVYQNDVKIGDATAAASANGNTTITAELTSAPDPEKDLNFYLGGRTPDYTGQVGLLTGTNSISEKYDYAMDCLAAYSYTVDNINKKVTPKEYTDPLEFIAAQQAIIKFTLLDSGGSPLISNPSALTITDGTSTVELTSIPGETYDTNGEGVLFVAFPAAGSEKIISMKAYVGSFTYIYETTSAKTFTNGQYYAITVRMKQVPKGALSGKFTINESGHQVYFSKGNLQATYVDDWNWGFAENQWDYIGNAKANKNVKDSSPWINGTGTVDLFGWSTDNENNYYGINSSYNNSDYSGEFVDWGNLAIENGGNTVNSGWRTLTSDEWVYVFNSRTTGGTVFETPYACYTYAIINTDDEDGVKGMILFPDGVNIASSEVTYSGAVNGYSEWGTQCTSAQWTALEAKGCVFLPAAGYRARNTVGKVGKNSPSGFYWSSSSYVNNHAYHVEFSNNELTSLEEYSHHNRYRGHSVRLVHNVQ